MQSNSSILLQELSIGYKTGKQEKQILPKLNMSIDKGELVALVGENGAGKSTLLRTIAKLQAPLNGTISFKNKQLSEWTRKDFARLVSFVSTEWINISNIKVEDLVALGRFPYTSWFGNLQQNDFDYVNQALEMVGMKAKAKKYFSELSDGERQRVMIARTLAQDTPIIIMDEPTAFLDLPNKYEIAHLLFRLTREQNKTILFSIHDLSIAMKEADKLWLINKNELIEGAPEDLILNRQLIDAFSINKLEFNSDTGEFYVPRKKGTDISINGKGEYFNWTVKALERLEFNVSCNKEATLSVKVDERNQSWIVTKGKNKSTCNSIYELSLTLKHI